MATHHYGKLLRPPPAARRGPRYVISHEGGRTTVEVDGVPIRHLAAAKVAFEPKALPKLDLTLCPLAGVVVLDGAQLTVDTVDLPETVARALYEFLRTRFELQDR